MKIEKIDYHRNGICGEGFYVAIVRSDEGERMVVVRFLCDEAVGAVTCAALNIDKLTPLKRLILFNQGYKAEAQL